MTWWISMPFSEAMLQSSKRRGFDKFRDNLQAFAATIDQTTQLEDFMAKKSNASRDICQLLAWITLPSHSLFDPRVIRGVHFDVLCGYQCSDWATYIQKHYAQPVESYLTEVTSMTSRDKAFGFKKATLDINQRLKTRDHWLAR